MRRRIGLIAFCVVCLGLGVLFFLPFNAPADPFRLFAGVRVSRSNESRGPKSWDYFARDTALIPGTTVEEADRRVRQELVRGWERAASFGTITYRRVDGLVRGRREIMVMLQSHPAGVWLEREERGRPPWDVFMP